MTHTPLQKELAIAIEGEKAKRAEIAKLTSRADALTEVFTQASASAETARDCLRSVLARQAAGEPVDVEPARAAHREATFALEEATLAQEGFADRVRAAEAEVVAAGRRAAGLASQLAQSACHAIELETLTLAKEVGERVVRRRQLARLAAQCETTARGQFSEPIVGASGEHTSFSRALETALAGPEAEAISVAQLLELE